MKLDNFLDDLNWRYATKLFDPNRKVPEEVLSKILEATRLSASSFGLQPWKVIVITDNNLKTELKPHSWNQPQITDCSHLIVLASKTSMDELYVSKAIKELSTERNIPEDSLSTYKELILGFLQNVQGEVGKNWMAKQAYIALGVLLSACAVAKIDACPMEGFDKTAFDNILNLAEEGLTTTVLCPIGFRSEDDKYSKLKKVRFSVKDIISVR